MQNKKNDLLTSQTASEIQLVNALYFQNKRKDKVQCEHACLGAKTFDAKFSRFSITESRGKSEIWARINSSVIE